MCVCFVGVKWLWDILICVLCELYDNGDLIFEEVVGVVYLILNCNVFEFYKFEGVCIGI